MTYRAKFSSLRYLRRALHLSPDSHHRQQLQQVLREGQNRGGDRSQEEEGVVGGGETGYECLQEG